MRFLLATAAFCLIAAAPARAQISFVPMAGYDIDAEAFQIGVGAEYALSPGVLPFTAAIRPGVHYIFADGDLTYIRVPVDLIGRFSAPGLPIAPYGKAGLIVEYTSVDVGNTSASNTELGLGLGVGAEYNRILAELTLGLGDVSNSQITVGYRF